MEKPMELKLAEFEKRVFETVNSSGIPPFCITPILERVLMKCRELEAYNLQEAQKQYLDGLAAEKRAEAEKVAPVQHDGEELVENINETE